MQSVNDRKKVGQQAKDYSKDAETESYTVLLDQTKTLLVCCLSACCSSHRHGVTVVEAAKCRQTQLNFLCIIMSFSCQLANRFFDRECLAEVVAKLTMSATPSTHPPRNQFLGSAAWLCRRSASLCNTDHFGSPHFNPSGT